MSSSKLKCNHDSPMMPSLSELGLMATCFLSAVIPGIITVIFRGPLKPNTFVSCSMSSQMERVHNCSNSLFYLDLDLLTLDFGLSNRFYNARGPSSIVSNSDGLQKISKAFYAHS